jgi:CheY-like chemotaxis protein
MDYNSQPAAKAREMKTILLAEDMEHDVFFVKRAFTKAALDYPLHVARDGDEAVHYLSGKGKFANRANHPIPALVFLDIKMPRRSGHEVLEWIRAQREFYTLPVVMLTSSQEPGDIERAYRAGANSYVVKPQQLGLLDELLPLVTKYWLETNFSLV